MAVFETMCVSIEPVLVSASINPFSIGMHDLWAIPSELESILVDIDRFSSHFNNSFSVVLATLG